MTSHKAELRLSRALAASDGRDTRRVRRARWAALGHERPVWKGHPTRTISRQQWEDQEAERKRIEREMRRAEILSMAKGVAARIANFITRKRSTASPTWRHQER